MVGHSSRKAKRVSAAPQGRLAGAPRRGGPNTKACGHIVDEGDV